MARKEYQPKDLLDRILGKSIWDMCEVFYERISLSDDPIVKKGMLSLMLRFGFMGVVFGIFCGLFIGAICFVISVGT
jgi:hypothetical protein